MESDSRASSVVSSAISSFSSFTSPLGGTQHRRHKTSNSHKRSTGSTDGSHYSFPLGHGANPKKGKSDCDIVLAASENNATVSFDKMRPFHALTRLRALYEFHLRNVPDRDRRKNPAMDVILYGRSSSTGYQTFDDVSSFLANQPGGAAAVTGAFSFAANNNSNTGSLANTSSLASYSSIAAFRARSAYDRRTKVRRVAEWYLNKTAAENIRIQDELHQQFLEKERERIRAEQEQLRKEQQRDALLRGLGPPHDHDHNHNHHHHDYPNNNEEEDELEGTFGRGGNGGGLDKNVLHPADRDRSDTATAGGRISPATTVGTAATTRFRLLQQQQSGFKKECSGHIVFFPSLMKVFCVAPKQSGSNSLVGLAIVAIVCAEHGDTSMANLAQRLAPFGVAVAMGRYSSNSSNNNTNNSADYGEDGAGALCERETHEIFPGVTKDEEKSVDGGKDCGASSQQSQSQQKARSHSAPPSSSSYRWKDRRDAFLDSVALEAAIHRDTRIIQKAVYSHLHQHPTSGGSSRRARNAAKGTAAAVLKQQQQQQQQQQQASPAPAAATAAAAATPPPSRNRRQRGMAITITPNALMMSPGSDGSASADGNKMGTSSSSSAAAAAADASPLSQLTPAEFLKLVGSPAALRDAILTTAEKRIRAASPPPPTTTATATATMSSPNSAARHAQQQHSSPGQSSPSPFFSSAYGSRLPEIQRKKQQQQQAASQNADMPPPPHYFVDARVDRPGFRDPVNRERNKFQKFLLPPTEAPVGDRLLSEFHRNKFHALATEVQRRYLCLCNDFGVKPNGTLMGKELSRFNTMEEVGGISLRGNYIGDRGILPILEMCRHHHHLVTRCGKMLLGTNNTATTAATTTTTTEARTWSASITGADIFRGGSGSGGGGGSSGATTTPTPSSDTSVSPLLPASALSHTQSPPTAKAHGSLAADPNKSPSVSQPRVTSSSTQQAGSATSASSPQQQQKQQKHGHDSALKSCTLTPNLKFIDLPSNGITDAGAEYIAEWLLERILVYAEQKKPQQQQQQQFQSSAVTTTTTTTRTSAASATGTAAPAAAAAALHQHGANENRDPAAATTRVPCFACRDIHSPLSTFSIDLSDNKDIGIGGGLALVKALETIRKVCKQEKWWKENEVHEEEDEDDDDEHTFGSRGGDDDDGEYGRRNLFERQQTGLMVSPSSAQLLKTQLKEQPGAIATSIGSLRMLMKAGGGGSGGDGDYFRKRGRDEEEKIFGGRLPGKNTEEPPPSDSVGDDSASMWRPTTSFTALDAGGFFSLKPDKSFSRNRRQKDDNGFASFYLKAPASPLARSPLVSAVAPPPPRSPIISGSLRVVSHSPKLKPLQSAGSGSGVGIISGGVDAGSDVVVGGDGGESGDNNNNNNNNDDDDGDNVFGPCIVETQCFSDDNLFSQRRFCLIRIDTRGTSIPPGLSRRIIDLGMV